MVCIYLTDTCEHTVLTRSTKCIHTNSKRNINILLYSKHITSIPWHIHMCTHTYMRAHTHTHTHTREVRAGKLKAMV